MRILFSKDAANSIKASLSTFGDAVVVKDGSLYKFYIHTISGLVLVEVVESIKIIEGRHTLSTIFDKRELESRTGNLKALQFFIGVFKNPDVQSFFQTAYDILSFKEERWDGDVLSRLYTTKAKTVENPQRNFISYLNETMKKSFNDLMKIGKTKTDALRQLKDENKEDFIQAFIEFKRSYPQKSILDE